MSFRAPRGARSQTSFGVLLLTPCGQVVLPHVYTLLCVFCSCVLAARAFCEEADDSFQDQTFLADRKTTVREWLSLNPEIMVRLI